MKQEDLELVKLALDQAVDDGDQEGLESMLDAAGAAARSMGFGPADFLASYLEGDEARNAETVEDLLGGWCHALMHAAASTFPSDKTFERIHVFAFVLEFAAGAALALGMPLEMGQKILTQCHTTLMEAAVKSEEAKAQRYELPAPLGES